MGKTFSIEKNPLKLEDINNLTENYQFLETCKNLNKILEKQPNIINNKYSKFLRVWQVSEIDFENNVENTNIKSNITNSLKQNNNINKVGTNTNSTSNKNFYKNMILNEPLKFNTLNNEDLFLKSDKSYIILINYIINKENSNNQKNNSISHTKNNSNSNNSFNQQIQDNFSLDFNFNSFMNNVIFQDLI